jgi:isoleucyl-tRNA synthetase
VTEEGPELEVRVEKAEGQKCARCWRIVPSVSADADTLGLCDRCVDAIASTRGPVVG